MRGGAGGSASASSERELATERSPTREVRDIPSATSQDYLTNLVMNDDPEDIGANYGIRAKGLVDLYKNFGHGNMWDGSGTLVSILKFLEYDAGLALDSAIPEDVLLTFTRQNRRAFPEKTTLRQFLKRYASKFPSGGTITSNLNEGNLNDPQFQSKLIGKGKLGGVSKAQLLPGAKLIELFRKLKQGGHLKTNIAVEQLFAYAKSKKERIPDVFQKHMQGIYDKRPRGVSGRDRRTMQLLTPFFRESLTPQFFNKSVSDQTQDLRSKRGPVSNVNNWRKILVEFFGHDADGLPNHKKVNTSYTTSEAERIWAPLSKEFQTLMKHSGIKEGKTLEDALTLMQFHSAGLSPSKDRAYAPRSRRGAGQDEEKDAPDEPAEKQPVARAVRSQVFFDHFVDVSPNINFHDISKPLGYTLLEGFEKSFKQWGQRSTHDKMSDKGIGIFQRCAIKQLNQAFGRRDRHGRYLFPKMANNSRNIDKDAQKQIFLKMGWNVYMSQQSVPQGRNAQSTMFKDVPSMKEAIRGSEPIFRAEEREDLEQMLLSLLAADTIAYNMREKDDEGKAYWKGSVETSKNLIMLKQRLDHWKQRAGRAYNTLEKEMGDAFPVPDWRERLEKHHQAHHLLSLYGEDGKKLRGMKKQYATLASVHNETRAARAQRRGKDAAAERKQIHSEAQRGIIRGRESRGGGIDMSPLQVKRRRDPRERSLTRDPVNVQDAIVEAKGLLGPAFDELAPEEQQTAVAQIIEQKAAENEDENDLGDEALIDDMGAELDDAEEAAVAELFMYAPPMQAHAQHKYGMVADALHPVNYGRVAHLHLLQTDNNVQPVMGRVHMVKPDRNFSDKHFMHDVEGDINEGQKSVVERSKRGPFRNQGGRSTIMDRSRHVVYRKRSGVFEITIRRGVLNGELDQMLSKLSMHRTHQHGSRVTIVKGSRRYRLGNLTDLDLRHLIDLVSECVSQYGNCGIEIVEAKPGSGPLYKDSMHGAGFKARTRRGKGVLHKR